MARHKPFQQGYLHITLAERKARSFELVKLMLFVIYTFIHKLHLNFIDGGREGSKILK